jgi:poly-beta-1,6-N-acetyl-D-glucosamine synthase
MKGSRDAMDGQSVIGFFSFLSNHEIPAGLLRTGLTFLLAYPFATCLLWSFSGLFYLARHHRSKRNLGHARNHHAYTVLIPFHAEPESALNTMRSLANVTPAPREIVIIDDGSPRSIPFSTVLPDNARIVRLPRNLGKAGALQSVLAEISTELVVCLDADTQSESPDWSPMLAAFDDPDLAAVTGKIRPVEGGAPLEWFQALDYLTVIAVIKAAESAWGGLLTVSGAFTAFRTSALRSIGGWSSKSSTEDIDASWRLQSMGWRLAFEKDWIARVEMAPNLPALWRQRRRWSAGLGRALRDYGANSVLNGARHLPVLVLTLASVSWIVTILTFCALALLNWNTAPSAAVQAFPNRFLYIMLTGVVAFFAQVVTAIAIDGRHPRQHWRSILIAPLYPVYFWSVLMSSFLAGFPIGFMRRDNGTWKRTQRKREVWAAE